MNFNRSMLSDMLITFIENLYSPLKTTIDEQLQVNIWERERKTI